MSSPRMSALRMAWGAYLSDPLAVYTRLWMESRWVLWVLDKGRRDGEKEGREENTTLNTGECVPRDPGCSVCIRPTECCSFICFEAMRARKKATPCPGVRACACVCVFECPCVCPKNSTMFPCTNLLEDNLVLSDIQQTTCSSAVAVIRHLRT
jgi:hypothetical protein